MQRTHPFARPAIQPYLVTAADMQKIEGRLFEAGIPVAALMEKVSGRLTQWFVHHYHQHYPQQDCSQRHHSPQTNKRQTNKRQIGVLAGPGHNGGDALVVARELYHQGFEVYIYQPFAKCKPLTEQHARYAKHLGIRFVESVEELTDCSAIIDGWFGFGLTRPITDTLACDIATLNQQTIPIFSIDLPSGIHTDTGQLMGTALKATYTACLGLWKRAFMQEQALEYFGQASLIDFDIPVADIEAVLGTSPSAQRIIDRTALNAIALHRSHTAHKYTAGHLLLIAGSRQYAGAALLAGLGAVASGVGMLTLAVPESIRLTLLTQLPGALIVGCAETEAGAIAHLPATVDLSKYDAIALGPGLTTATPS
ncbi:MAG: NAD(P)H-hydrate epimerase, partial [Cyanobacteria bacterium J06649_4]